MTQAFKISQLDGLFLLRSERSHQSADAFGAALFVEKLFVFWRDDDRWQVAGQILAAALALAFQAQMIESAIARHGAQPGEEGAASGVVLICVAPKLEENILHDFFGGRSVLQDTQDQAVDEARVAVIELFEGAHVFLKEAQQQRRVWRHFAGTTGCESRQEHESRLLPLLKNYTTEKLKWMLFHELRRLLLPYGRKFPARPIGLVRCTRR